MSGEQKSDMGRLLAAMTLAELVALRDRIAVEIAARLRASEEGRS